MKRFNCIDDLVTFRRSLIEKGLLVLGKNRIKVCCGTACNASGSHKVVKALKESLKSDSDIELLKTGCQGLCQKGPVMKVEPYGYFYQRVGPENVPAVISTYTIGQTARAIPYSKSFLEIQKEIMEDVPYYKKQVRVVLRHNG